MRLLDTRFKYVPSTSTNVTSTWRRFGFRPTTEAERLARQRRLQPSVPSAEITQLQPGKRKVAAPALRLTVK
jgi:hypothetical protein